MLYISERQVQIPALTSHKKTAAKKTAVVKFIVVVLRELLFLLFSCGCSQLQDIRYLLK